MTNQPTVGMLANYIREHGLPAEPVANGILTRDQYVDTQGNYHDEPFIVPANLTAIRDWLGY